MQTRLIDSLQLDAYAGRRWTVRRQRWTVRRRRRRTVPVYEACVDVGKSSANERMQPARRLHAGCIKPFVQPACRS